MDPTFREMNEAGGADVKGTNYLSHDLPSGVENV
jgi:hypothetical protein